MTRRQHANKFRWRVRLLGFGGWCTRSTCGMGKLCCRVWCGPRFRELRSTHPADRVRLRQRSLQRGTGGGQKAAPSHGRRTRRTIAAPRPASHANACALPGPRHSFARGGEDTSRSGSVLRAYCILDAELSDVIVFAAPRSTPARARPRATPFAQQHLKFHGPQIRVGA